MMMNAPCRRPVTGVRVFHLPVHFDVYIMSGFLLALGPQTQSHLPLKHHPPFLVTQQIS